jgi:outer membrane protein assembly factor BamB
MHGAMMRRAAGSHSMTLMRTVCPALLLCLTAAVTARAADWPQFRGPSSLAYADEKNLPTRWGGKDDENILWKTPLPQADNPFSSPIVSAGRIFLTIVKNKPLAQTVLCFEKSTGKPLWQTQVDAGPLKLTDLRGGYGAPTPAADGEHVFALFGSASLACLDYDGKVIWRKDLPRISFDVAIGTSPVLFEQSVILQCDQNAKKSSLIAFDKKTGEIKWEQLRPDVSFAHSTPILAQIMGKPQLICSASNALQGINPSDGKRLWSIESSGETASPALGDGMIYADTGRGGGGVCADVSTDPPKPLWKSGGNEVGEGLGSPIIVDGFVYRMHKGDLLLCRDAKNGHTAFSEHLLKMSSWPSPFWTADHTIYFATAGMSYVIKPGGKLEIIAKNEMNDPNPAASPAVSDGMIFLRGMKYLYCIAKK